MRVLQACCQPNRLLTAGYWLLWPLVAMVVTRRSYDARIFGFWSPRAFAMVVVSIGVLAAASIAVTWCLRSHADPPPAERLLHWLRRYRIVAGMAVLFPPLAWIGLVGYALLIGVPGSPGAALAILNLTLLVVVWEAAILLAARPPAVQRDRLQKMLLAGASTAISLALVELAGQLGQLPPTDDWETNPPRLDVSFRTDDFDVRVVTNSQGLREPREVPPDHPGTRRIVVIGDSMTFGWGVEYDETYPHVTESLMRSKYELNNIEVVNMGRPGTTPLEYLKYVRQYAPQLNPDLIVVGFHVGNDCPVLAPPRCRSPQEAADTAKRFLAASRQGSLAQPLQRFYLVRLMSTGFLGGLHGLERIGAVGEPGPFFREPNPLDPASLQAEIRQLDDPAGGTARYERLLREGWVDKGLMWVVNPSLVKGMILRPHGPADQLAVRPETREVMENEWRICEHLLLEMKSSARDCGAQLVVLAIPNVTQVSRRWVDFLEQRGCILNAEMTTSRRVNDWVLTFCAENEVPCIDPLERLRTASRQGMPLYFPTDDHMTPQGNQLLADALSETLAPLLGKQIDQAIPPRP